MGLFALQSCAINYKIRSVNPCHKTSIARKLQKQAALYSKKAVEDCILTLSHALCIDNITELISAVGSAKGPVRGMCLHEQNNVLLSSLIDTNLSIDQTPFMDGLSEDVLNGHLSPLEQYDFVVSNLAFDWIDAGNFIRISQGLLKPNGLLWFSAYGASTASNTVSILNELDGCTTHFNVFYTMQDIGDALLGTGYKEVVLDSTKVNLEYASVEALLADAVRIMGCHCADQPRKGLSSHEKLRAFKARVNEIIEVEGKYVEQVEILTARARNTAEVNLGVIPVRQA